MMFTQQQPTNSGLFSLVLCMVTSVVVNGQVPVGGLMNNIGQQQQGGGGGVAIQTEIVVDVESDVVDTSDNCTSITDIACDEDNNLKALCEAIQLSNLDDDFSTETWTVFAPDDAAFEALGRSNLDSLVFGSNDTQPLTNMLLFHVVPGVAVASRNLPCVAGANLVQMANGKMSRTLCVKKKLPMHQKGEFNSASNPPNIIQPDIPACNGVIHIIDKVMLDQKLPYPIPGSENDYFGENFYDVPNTVVDNTADISSSVSNVESESSDIEISGDTSEFTDSVSGTNVEFSVEISVESDIIDDDEEEEMVIEEDQKEEEEIDEEQEEEEMAVEEEEEPTTPAGTTASTTEAPSGAGTTWMPTTEVMGELVNAGVSGGEEGEECSSIARIVCTTPAFNIVCGLLEENAMLDDLNDGLWTFFAPTNNAFDKAPRITADIENVLLGHTISNELISYEDLICSQKTEMANGQYTRTICEDGTDVGEDGIPRTYQNGKGNFDEQRPEIVDINIPACNGIIHVVSEVILF